MTWLARYSLGAANVEEALLTEWLKRQGHNDKVIGKVLYEILSGGDARGQVENDKHMTLELERQVDINTIDCRVGDS